MLKQLFGSDKNPTAQLNWNSLSSIEELDKIDSLSAEKPVVLFKHSTRCSISSSALNRIERSWNQEEMGSVVPFYLDLIQNRPVSSEIERRYGVFHESPQVLVIEKGKCVYHTSHNGINYKDLQAFAKA